MTTPAVPQIGAAGDQLVSAGGQKSALGLTVPTVIKNSAGRICRVTVIVAGTAAGTINDLATTIGAAASNQVGVLPNAVGTYAIDMPCAAGIMVAPGAGQTVAVSYL